VNVPLGKRAGHQGGKLVAMSEHDDEYAFRALLTDHDSAETEQPDEPRRPRRFAASIMAVLVAVSLVVATGGVGLGAIYAGTTRPSAPHSVLPPGSFAGHQPPGRIRDTRDLDVTPATASESRGVVTIVTDLYYDGYSQAAGTGIILSADGLVLTNEHVVDGSTELVVTVESTGTEYSATVLGSDSVKDVALIKLNNAIGLTPRIINTDAAVKEGDIVSSIGNARGTGNLVVATGPVVDAHESISVASDAANSSHELDDVMEFKADVVSGDSGGPLVNEDGDVVGMVSAASTASTNIRGFAIRIAVVMDVANQILAGDESGTVRIGPRAFFGVELAEKQGDTGVTVQAAISGMPAEAAGLAEGDIITAVDDEKVLTVEELSAAIAAHEPGDSVTISYTTAAGEDKAVTVLLAAGPGA
jgi:S1-C subfamily serine protease